MTRRRTAPLAVAAVFALAALSAAFALGRSSVSSRATPTTSPAPVTAVNGILVGVEHSPAGALAAADNYVALESETVEQDPSLFARLVHTVYDPAIWSTTLYQATQIRTVDVANVANYQAGGRGIAVIGARRLDSYTPALAVVTTWLGGFVWGPSFPPRQTWNLVDTTLRWHQGRWLVAASATDSRPAPVPSTVIVDGPNNRSAAFGRGLSGMTPPFYGTG